MKKRDRVKERSLCFLLFYTKMAVKVQKTTIYIFIQFLYNKSKVRQNVFRREK